MEAIIKNIGLIDYQDCLIRMQKFTENRDIETPDQFWLVQHFDIFTLGLAAKEEHILNTNHNIPIFRTDRGGQVTYHGPGQIIIYCLVDLKRLNLSVRDFVCKIEDGVVGYLNQFNINAYGNRSAPGVYVNQQKIASLGLKIRKGSTYHGLSFNYNCNKIPFTYINPCGYAGLKVINFAELVNPLPKFSLAQINLAKSIICQLNNHYSIDEEI